MPDLLHCNSRTHHSQAPPALLNLAFARPREEAMTDKDSYSPDGTPQASSVQLLLDLSKLSLSHLLTLREIVKRAKLGTSVQELCELRGFTASPIRRAVASLLETNFINRDLTAQAISGLKGTYRYYPAEGLSLEIVEVAIQRASDAFRVSPPSTALEAADPSLSSSTTQFLEKFIEGIRLPYRLAHFQILQLIAREGCTNISGASEKLSRSQQTTHSQLERSRQSGILSRKKRRVGSSSEYFYTLSKGLTPEHIETFEISRFLEDLPQLPIQISDSSLPNPQDEARDIMSTTLSSQPEQSSPAPVDLVRVFLEKLPVFDPMWPPEAQKSWRETLEFSVRLGREMNLES